MAADVTIPRLGWSMEEGVFAGWLKQPGEAVKPGEPLFMLEGEKATQEIEAVDGGVLHVAPDAPSQGQTVLVGRLIGRLCAAGESPAWPAARAPVPASRAAADEVSAQAAGAAIEPGRGGSSSPRAIPAAASPSVRRLARQLGIDLADVSPRLPGGRLCVEDLAPRRHESGLPAAGTAAGATEPPRSSPRARRAARNRGIDLATVRGGGAGGRVRERDVLAVAAAGAGGQAVRAAGPADGATMPISHVRRSIARQMVHSRGTTVPVTLTAWADATALVAARAAAKAAASAEAATLNDIILTLLAAAIRAEPIMAARWEETHLVLPGERIDIGLAVDAPGGLVVPVIRDVARVGLAEVARQTRSLVERARAGRLAAADMQGGVFTLTSLGSYGVEFFTPVINPPEAAILGVGAIRMLPVPPPGGEPGFVLARQIPLSLTFDHRVVDGGPAARFLADVARRIAAVAPDAA